MNDHRLVAGCMTGTSIDSLDAALVEISGRGLEMRARFVRGVARELGPLKPRLRAIAEQKPVTAGEAAAAMHELGVLHASAVKELAAGGRLDLVCVHGQTVYHRPPLSWQLIQPAPIARAMRCPVVFDLRAADLAAGGQGAPITPIADWVLFASATHGRDVVNLGGFCNITHLPARGRRAASGGPEAAPAAVAGKDVCACNQVLDAVARATIGEPFDRDGEMAARGEPDEGAAGQLLTLLHHQAHSGRSLGTGDELHSWIEAARHVLPPEVVAASACEALGRVIAGQFGRSATEAVLAGGGVRNKALVGAIRRHAEVEVRMSDSLGTPAPHREAACFAVLGALCQDRVPITPPRTRAGEVSPEIGAPPVISGHWVLP
jgi:anhydro-N-acetylmuramic acid kinase